MKKIVVLLFVLILCSCRTTKYVEVEKLVEKTEYETVYSRDSIYMRDSIHIHHKGDTVYQDRWHTKYIERERTDTFIKTDSVRVPIPYYIEKELSSLDRLKMDLAAPMTMIALLMTCALLYRIRN